MHKTTMVYSPVIEAAIVDLDGRDHAARHTFQRRALPSAELVLRGTFTASNRTRLVYRIEVEGREIGTAIERPDDLKPWRLTMPGHCGNLAYYTRADLLAVVARILSSGSIWN